VRPTVAANLTANLLEECARHLAQADQIPNGLVCSGMLESEIDRVASAFAEVGLPAARTRVDGEWGALLLRREPD
jgi:ribosomal protein L11 methylase PrmA